MSKKNVLVVGAGSIGERHTRCFGLTGRVEVSLCELDSKKCQEVAQRYSITKSFTSWEQALKEQPEIVVIATPAHLHISMATQAVAQGCHVLIEKPLSISQTGIDELQALIDRQGVQVSIAYVYRCHPALIAMRDAIHSGRFGKPLQVIASSGQHFPFYRPAYRETYYTRHETGGGAVQDALTHVINAAEWLVGPITRLVGDAEHLALPGVTVEDSVQVLTRHGSVLGCFQLNQHQAPNEGFINVVCEKGTASFEGHNHRWRWVVEPGGTWNNHEQGPLERDSLFIAQAHQFLDVVEGKAKPACPLSEAAQTLKVNLAILESIRKQAWQTL
ncbi:MAG: Gfo/Idh/MocA family oxidoreductase [Planctomycetes bacterium]|nr:Gfo/Idh/MocA family oxidoreductase [Planctomycetota bacterium]